MEESLGDLARRHGSDKAEHGYTPLYEQLFASRRLDPLRILELGVGGSDHPDDPSVGGASLRMWRDYFPNARIWGVDILDKSAVAGDRITFVRASQVDQELLGQLIAQEGPFDLIVDDASHISALTNRSFKILFPTLASDGVYVIEDLCTSYWPLWGGRLRRSSKTTTMALIKNRLDGLNHAEFKLPNYHASGIDKSVCEIRARHNIVAFVKGANNISSDLNHENPVDCGLWFRRDFLPGAVFTIGRLGVLKLLDLVGLRARLTYFKPRSSAPGPQ